MYRSLRHVRFFAFAGGLVALAVSWHGELPAMGNEAATPAAKPAACSLEELLSVLEDAHGVSFEECRKPVKGMGLCGQTHDAAIEVRETLRTCLGDRVNPSNWEERKKNSRLQFTLGKRNVVVTLHNTKPTLSIAFNPAVPDCGNDPRGYRWDEFKDNPRFRNPELIEKVAPEFPARAVSEYMRGRVVLLGTVDTNGRVLDICLLRVNPRGYDVEAPAFDALRRWQYLPATLDGEPIDTGFTIVMEWSR